MKKIISLLVILISLCAKSQNVNPTFTWQEWKWLVGGWNRTDSLSDIDFRVIDSTLDAVSNITSNTNVTIVISENLAILFYSMGQGATRGEARTLPNNGNNFRTVFRTFPSLVARCDIIDNSWDAATDNRQRRGKNIIGKNN